ncbi:MULTISPECIES: Bcr/CflA family multidrug efflux MFS transporter [Halomonas]|uniref:Bcr/CflA family efflux transporter n=2 Tax=Halomonas TaxID=2745 RepID=A0ABQ0U173_9GAMM|nr:MULTISPECIES: Bcr/CflA family multidrug efflux MFS transporter [Halomonas]PSJ21017.1 Bcr/CflA family drug resistance efflux transporter [Halomonas sp. ND22Bw]KGE76839.1 multidrug transporter CflA [Halomonas salina]MDR5888050.1 Bcr/CflA family multidrug efflux MFS transporter [Halomonas salina]RAH37468.1 Bcr/CflA family drug resistance efflux transporter [Halomonas sp. SL1]WJY08575.1 Bcr/CflA family multidrug efflux MFS transporter [Halomonas halophila]
MTLSARRVALLVATNTALAPFAIDAYLPAMPALAEAVGASVHHTELSISLFLFGFAFGQLFGGPLSDRLGRRPVLLVGLVIFLLASLMIMRVESLGELLTWRFVQALGGGACVVNSAAIVRDCFSGREAAKVMSTMAMILMLAPLVAPAVGSGLFYLADWWLIFAFLAAYAAFLLWLMGTRLPETRPVDAPIASAGQVLRNYGSVLRHREAMGYVLSVASTFSGMFAFITASPFLYMTHYGVSPAIYPVVFGANVVVMAFSNRINIRLLRHRTPQQNMRLGLGVQLCVALSLVMLVATGLDSLATVVPLIMLFMGMVGLITPNAMASMLEHFSHMSATATALLGCIQFTCGALAGVVVSAFEVDSAWPMVLTMLTVSLIGNLALRALAGRAALH